MIGNYHRWPFAPPSPERCRALLVTAQPVHDLYQRRLAELDVRLVDDPKNSILPRIKLRSPTVEERLVERLAGTGAGGAATVGTTSVTRKYPPEVVRRLGRVDERRSPLVKRYPPLANAEETVQRLFAREVSEREQRRLALEQKYHPEEPDRVLSVAEQEEHVQRLYQDSGDMRAEALAELEATVYQEQDRRCLAPEELEESVNRLYYQATEAREERQREREKRHAFRRKPAKRLPGAELASLSDRLAKPRSSSTAAKAP